MDFAKILAKVLSMWILQLPMKEIKLPRWMHKIYAKSMGYYWLPCPLCGKYVGGHEFDFSKNGALIIEPGEAWTTCSGCKEKAERINISKFGHRWTDK